MVRSLSKAKEKIEPAGFTGQTRDEAMAVAFRTFAIAEMVVAARRVFEAEYENIMSGSYPHELLYKSDAGSLAKACKDIGFKYVYVAPEILKREIMGREVVFDLLNLYWEVAQGMAPGKQAEGFDKKVYGQISSNYRHIFEHNIVRSDELKIPVQYFRMQLITDQISGMTDSFAVKLHRELKNG